MQEDLETAAARAMLVIGSKTSEKSSAERLRDALAQNASGNAGVERVTREYDEKSFDEAPAAMVKPERPA